MSFLTVDHQKCILCGKCLEACPFNALSLSDRLQIKDSCRLCNICVKICPEHALAIQQEQKKPTHPEHDLSSFKNVLVFAEQRGNKLAEVVFELIGKGRELASKLKQKLFVVLVSSSTARLVEELKDYPLDGIYVYDHPELSFYRAETYTAALHDLILELKPSILLLGATQVGRSLAPRIATRLRTGLTADCTSLDVKPNGDLIQTRPAFGGNVMAQIITPNHRPQLATVRPKVMSPAKKGPGQPQVIYRKLTKSMLESRISFLSIDPKAQDTSITEADILIAVGRGLKKAEDLTLIEELARPLEAMVAVTRPLVELGWAPYTKQVGLSGRTVKPKLFISCGISGAIQHIAGMSGSDFIIAINKDPHAPIFQIAHLGLVGDLYDILPALTTEIIKEIHSKRKQVEA